MLSFVLIFAFILSALLAWFYISQIAAFAYSNELFDIPNNRKMHQTSIPRLGGVAFLPALFISFFVSLAISYKFGYQVLSAPIILDFCALATGLTILYFTGIFDDLADLRYNTKLAIQILVACFFPISGLWINNLYGVFGFYDISPWFGIPLTVLLIIFIVNAINLIDGIDGLASGLSIVALCMFGILFLLKGFWLYSLLSISMLGLLSTFFSYNVFGSIKKRRKIFMGDTGSLILGYILAFLSIRYVSVNTALAPFSKEALLVAYSTLMVPMLDVLHVMYIRMCERKNIFAPDRSSHIHHRFMSMGLTPRQTMVAIILLSCTFTLANIVLNPIININLLLLVNIVLWITFNWTFSRVNKWHNQRLVSKALNTTYLD